MVNFQDQAQNEKLTINIKQPNNSSPALSSPVHGDLEAARSGNNRNLSPPIILAQHRAESIPGSVTSLPVTGIEPAPTHRRRRNRRRRNNQQQQTGNGGAQAGIGDGTVASGPPRRANSLPARTAPTETNPAPPGQPFDWLKNLDTLLVPQKKIVQRPNLTQCFVNTIKYSWINVMLLLIPVAWGMHFSHQPDTVVFVFSFLSIIPLAALLGFATEELANYTGPTIGGLFNATFGNAVELIISILALVKGQLRIVQAAMLGSILSNCLLVLGMCFLAGGFRFHEQGYGVRIAQQQISLLSLSVFSISIPAAFNSSVKVVEESDILAISRATSVILLVCYMAFLVFQLWTHSYLYTIESSKRHAAVTFVAADEGAAGPPIGQSVFRVSSIFSHSSSSSSSSSENGSPTTATATVQITARPQGEEEEEEEIPKLTVKFAFALLVVVTVLTGLTAEFLVDSIAGLIATTAVTEEFVALILLPLVGNAAEHVTAVTVSVRNKLDLALAVAVGSSIQIALFVLPFLVVLGWIIGQPLNLNFDNFEVIVVVLSVIVVNFAISDGRTNWLEGFILMVTYLLIGVAVFYYN